MRFNLFGQLDAPDFVLQELSYVAKMSSVKVKVLVGHIVSDMLAQKEIDYKKVEKLTADARFSPSDVKAAVAVLTHVLSNAARFDVEDQVLSNELQQLGLPKEHADSVSRTYRDKKAELQERLSSTSLHLPQLSSVEWRVDYVLASSHLLDVGQPVVHLRIARKDGVVEAFEVPAEKMRVLVAELETARGVMETIGN